MSRLLAALLVLLAALAGAGSAAAAPQDLASDSLDRASLLALPSIYRADVVLRVRALRVGRGTNVRRLALPPAAQRIVERGTAVAVAPNGWLVTAGHLVTPNQRTLARLAYQAYAQARESPVSATAATAWVRRTRAVPLGARVIRRTVTQAASPSWGGAPRKYVPTQVIGSTDADLALMKIDAPGAPALELEDSISITTPVVTIGYGYPLAERPTSKSAQLEPMVKRGELGRTFLWKGQTSLPPDGSARSPLGSIGVVVTTPIERGDSGGPAVDQAGRMRGIVVATTEGQGALDTSASVRALLGQHGLEPEPGPAGTGFRAAMTSFWAFDLDDARRELVAVRHAFPEHLLAAYETRRADQLLMAGFELTPSRRLNSFLLALGVLSAAAALACAAGLVAPLLRGRWSVARRD